MDNDGMDYADCLWESSRSSDHLQRRRVGHTWSCCSVERRLDDIWRTVVDYERRHSRPAWKSDRYRGTEWRRQRNIMVPSLNLTRCGTLSQWSSLQRMSVSPRSYFRVSVMTRAAALSTHCSLCVVAFGDSAWTRYRHRVFDLMHLDLKSWISGISTT